MKRKQLYWKQNRTVRLKKSNSKWIGLFQSINMKCRFSLHTWESLQNTVTTTTSWKDLNLFGSKVHTLAKPHMKCRFSFHTWETVKATITCRELKTLCLAQKCTSGQNLTWMQFSYHTSISLKDTIYLEHLASFYMWLVVAVQVLFVRDVVW